MAGIKNQDPKAPLILKKKGTLKATDLVRIWSDGQHYPLFTRDQLPSVNQQAFPEGENIGYFYYDGVWYHMGDFIVVSPFAGWNGWKSMGKGWGIVIKFVGDKEKHIQIGEWRASNDV